jgi:hypothetical protein
VQGARINWSLASNLPTEPLGLDFDGCLLASLGIDLS